MDNLVSSVNDNTAVEARTHETIFELLQVIAERRSKVNAGTMLRSPFPVRRSEDGDNREAAGTNQYGWGADYSETCGLGVVLSSGGTPACT